MASPGCGAGGTGGWSCGGVGAAVDPSGVPHFTQNRVPGSFEAPQLVQNIGTLILRWSANNLLLYSKRQAFATELECLGTDMASKRQTQVLGVLRKTPYSLSIFPEQD